MRGWRPAVVAALRRKTSPCFGIACSIARPVWAYHGDVASVVVGRLLDRAGSVRYAQRCRSA
jgi:hypothetical protein